MKEKFISQENTKNISLSNTENYREHVNVSLNEIMDSYLKIIGEYMTLLSENEYIKNLIYFKFILIRGLETITTIFRLILFFTKNIILVNYHTQKAFYVYIEFIEQISDAQNSFLHLTSRDAVLFVYKKTIYEINNEYRKKIKEENIEKKLFEKLDDYLNMNKNIISFYLQHIEFTYDNRRNIICLCCERLKRYTRILYQINPASSNNSNHNPAGFDLTSTQKAIVCINSFVDRVAALGSDNQESIEDFFRNISKNKENSFYDAVLQKISEIQNKEDIKFICHM